MINNDKNDNYINITFREYFYKKYIDRTISEGIYSVLYANTNVSEQQETQNSISKRDKFIYSLSFKDWFDLYGIYTFRKIKNRIFKYIFVFVLINILLLLSTSIYGLLQKEYRVQQALLRPADFITKAYIYPLSKIGGYKNIFTKPFYAVRDLLYNKGISLLPDDSPEKIVWWYSIKFTEFASIFVPELQKNIINRKEITNKKVERLRIWNDEIYNKILIFKETDLSKTIYRNNKLLIYRDLIQFYNDGEMLLINTLFFKKYKTYKKGEIYQHVSDDQDMTIKLLDDFDQLKEILKKTNSNDYKKYMKQPIIEEYIFRRNCLGNFLSVKEKYGELSCSSHETIMYHEMGLKILKYIITDFDNL